MSKQVVLDSMNKSEGQTRSRCARHTAQTPATPSAINSYDNTIERRTPLMTLTPLEECQQRVDGAN